MNTVDDRQLKTIGIFNYRVNSGEILTGLAKQFCKDANKSAIIAQANTIPDPDYLRPGQIIVIPCLPDK